MTGCYFCVLRPISRLVRRLRFARFNKGFCARFQPPVEIFRPPVETSNLRLESQPPAEISGLSANSTRAISTGGWDFQSPVEIASLGWNLNRRLRFSIGFSTGRFRPVEICDASNRKRRLLAFFNRRLKSQSPVERNAMRRIASVDCSLFWTGGWDFNRRLRFEISTGGLIWKWA